MTSFSAIPKPPLKGQKPPLSARMAGAIASGLTDPVIRLTSFSIAIGRQAHFHSSTTVVCRCVVGSAMVAYDLMKPAMKRSGLSRVTFKITGFIGKTQPAGHPPLKLKT